MREGICAFVNPRATQGLMGAGTWIWGDLGALSVRTVCVFVYEQEGCQSSGSMCLGGKENCDVFVYR